MSNEQESLTLIQGWTSAIILALATLLLLHRTFTIFIVPIFTTVQNKVTNSNYFNVTIRIIIPVIKLCTAAWQNRRY